VFVDVVVISLSIPIKNQFQRIGCGIDFTIIGSCVPLYKAFDDDQFGKSTQPVLAGRLQRETVGEKNQAPNRRRNSFGPPFFSRFLFIRQRIGIKSLLDNVIITSFQFLALLPTIRRVLVFGFFHGVLHIQQTVNQLIRTLLILHFIKKNQFAEQMGIAQSMVAIVRLFLAFCSSTCFRRSRKALFSAVSSSNVKRQLFLPVFPGVKFIS
jgi:hypothetical protein